MLFNKIVFAEQMWLWGLLLIPLVTIFFKVIKKANKKNLGLANFAEPELLPHLLQQTPTASPVAKLLGLWCLLWLLAIIALANPRWRFVEYESYKPESALVIVLDLANTMQAEDLKPTRLVRAKQQIHDILQAGKGLRIGLLAYAAYPHIVSPITDDLATLTYLLPVLDTDLISKQGKDLNAALIEAQKLLQAEPGDCKHILVISDGDFNNNFSETVKTLHKNNIAIHVAAVGTKTGAPFKDSSGALYREKGKIQISKLNELVLMNIAKIGSGKFWHINYSELDTKGFIKLVLNNKASKTSVSNSNIRQWEEGFFWFILPMLITALLFKRKQMQLWFFVLCIGGCLFCAAETCYALPNFLQNTEQQGEILFQQSDYEKAAVKFSDPYHKGVAFYKAGKFADAELEFKKSTRNKVKLQAKYNLANSLLKQKKCQPAIDLYEDLLAEVADHKGARDNLAIAKKLLAEQQQNQAENKPDCNCKNKKGAADKNQPSDNRSQSKPASDEANKADANKNTENQKTNQPEKSTKNTGVEDNSDKKPTQQNSSQEDDSKQDQKASEDTKKETVNEQLESAAKEEKAETLNAAEKASNSAAPTDNKNKPDEETELWLKRMNSDIKIFMKNKFLIEENK